MKKIFLLLAAGSIAMNLSAQERKVVTFSPGVNTSNRAIDVDAFHKDFMEKHMSSVATGAAKGTSYPGGQWYNYGVYMSLSAAAGRLAGTGSEYVYGYDLEMWNDTLGILGYTSGTPSYKHCNMVSIANITDPTFSGFNNVALYTGTPAPMKITASDAYVVDSVLVPGDYFYGSKSSAAVVDTLRLSFIVGNGTTPTASSIFTGGLGGGGHYGTDKFLNVAYDSVMNRGAGTSGGTAAQHMDILLKNSDTSSTTVYSKSHLIVDASGAAAPISVPAGNYIACTITFKSGDPATHVGGILYTLPGDTLRGAVAPYTRYNMFRPIVDYYESAGDPTTVTTLPNADWAPYGFTTASPNADLNTGGFKTLPNTTIYNWNNEYIPLWAWSTSTGASLLQYPEVAYHITCASCNPAPENVGTTAKVNSISVTPNPANNVVNFQYSLTKATDVSISLTNMLGQVVASKTFSNTSNGTTLLNTSNLPSGVYIYTMEADGGRTTGRVVVAH